MEDTIKIKANMYSDIYEVLGGKKNKAKLEAINDKLSINIKATTTYDGITNFILDIGRLKFLSKDTKYIIIHAYLQLGKPEECNRVFDYNNTNDITIVLQPKIKNYIEFKTKGSAEKYREEQLSENDICLLLEVKDGRVQITLNEYHDKLYKLLIK